LALDGSNFLGNSWVKSRVAMLLRLSGFSSRSSQLRRVIATLTAGESNWEEEHLAPQSGLR
jgi:hypothetical protein